jgi:putative endonuclease
VPDYYVYVMTNNSGTLYIGVTNDIARRVREHQLGLKRGFTQRYRMTRLLYVESATDVRDALQREKQLKGWTRKRKLDLVRSLNPEWRDLSQDWSEQSLAAMTARSQILRSSE